MIRWIVAMSLQARFLIVGIAVAVMAIGGARMLDRPISLYPEFAPPSVTVRTEALGLSADEVEAMITVPLEADMLNGISWVKDIRSESMPGLSSIVLIFEPGTDILSARQLVQERLTAAHALPNVSKPPMMLNPVSSTARVLQVGLSSTSLTPIELSVLARWTIQPRLMGVPGVANVSIWGERRRQLQVQVDTDVLKSHDLSLWQVVETAGNAMWVSPLSYLNASTPGTGGFIDTPNQRLGVRHVLPITTSDDLAQINVAGTPFRLGEVTHVVEDHQPLIGDAVIGADANLLLVIEKFPLASTVKVSQAVEAALEELRPGLVGVSINTEVFKPATFAQSALDNLTAVLIGGFVLSALVLIGFFFDWRSAIVSIISIPLSLVTAALVLELLGAPSNAMVLAGLVVALAVVIDDAVVGADRIRRALSAPPQEGQERSTFRIVLETVAASRGLLVYATLIMVLFATPVFFLTGVVSAFLEPVVYSYVVAILVSMVVGMSVAPALYVLLGPKVSEVSEEQRGSPVVRRLQGLVDGAITRSAGRPKVAYAIFAGLVIVTVGAVPFLRHDLTPAFNELDLLVSWKALPGASQPAARRLAERATQEIRGIPGIKNVGAHVGRAFLSDMVANVDRTEIWISIDPSADYDETLAAIRETVAGYPGVDDAVIRYPQQRIEAIEDDQDGRKLVVRVYGHDFDILKAKAAQISQAIAGVDGVKDTEVDATIEEPVIEIRPNLERSMKHGIKPGDVRRQVAAMMSGIQVGSLFADQKVFDVVVWGVPEMRHSVSGLRNLMLETYNGISVPLHEVADVAVVMKPIVINRDAVSRYVDVVVEVDGNLDEVAAAVKSRIDRIDFPLEYHFETANAAFELEAVSDRVVSVTIAALVVIFLLLQACLGSWRLGVIAFLALPAALLGCVVALLALGGTLSFGGAFGLLGVLGLATRQGILLLRHYQLLHQEDSEASCTAVVTRGTKEQVGPMCATAVATAAAFLPLVIFGGAAGLEVFYPMAVVMIGGLVTSTLFYLFVIPAVYVAVRGDVGAVSKLNIGGSEVYGVH